MEIRKIDLQDIEQLKKIGRLTFAETFASDNSEEDMTEYLISEFSNEKLKKELTDRNTEFYFAQILGEVIGYLKVNLGESQTEIQDKNALEIERVYVLKEFHGKKIGQALYEKALERAKQKKVEFIWLGVWERNHLAIGFYKKNGFEAFDTHIFKLGNDEQTDIMMKLDLLGKS